MKKIIFLLFIPILLFSNNISSWLDQENISYEQPEENTWQIPFTSSQGGTIIIGVLLVEDNWVLIMAPLFEIPQNYPEDAFKKTAEANYQMNQMKLGLAENNYLFLQMEIPYYLITKEELIKDIEFLAYAVDENLETIASWFGLFLE